MNNWELGCSYCVRPEYGKESSSLESAFLLGHLSLVWKGQQVGSWVQQAPVEFFAVAEEGIIHVL